MIIDDPSKFHLLTRDLREQIIKGATATVNMMAFKARKEAIRNLQSDFTNRNNFTARQVQVTPMQQGYHTLAAINSIVGVTEKASYMARQEEGGVHTPRQGSKLAIPTDAARGGSFRNPVQKQMMVKNVRQKKRRVHGKPRSFERRLKNGKVITVKAKTYKSQKAWFIARAAAAFNKNLLLPMGGSGGNRNLFYVTKFTAVGNKDSRKAEFEHEEVYNFERQNMLTRARPWFRPACEKVAKDVDKIFISQMKKLGM
jgi:hypothetical protein